MLKSSQEGLNPSGLQRSMLSPQPFHEALECVWKFRWFCSPITPVFRFVSDVWKLEYFKLLLLCHCLGYKWDFYFAFTAIQNSLNCELNREKDLRLEAEEKERVSQESEEKAKQLVTDLQTQLKDLKSTKVTDLVKWEVTLDRLFYAFNRVHNSYCVLDCQPGGWGSTPWQDRKICKMSAALAPPRQ